MKKSIFFVLAAVMFFTGCGGPAGDGSKTTGGKAGKSEMEQVCKYFPKELIEEAIGKPIVKVEDSSLVEDFVCIYYTSWSETFDHTPYGDHPGGPHVIVVLKDESVAAGKADLEADGYTFKKDETYSWDNYLVTSRGGKTPYRADLIVNENRYFMIKSNHFAVTDEEIVKIGKRFSERMKNGK